MWVCVQMCLFLGGEGDHSHVERHSVSRHAYMAVSWQVDLGVPTPMKNTGSQPYAGKVSGSNGWNGRGYFLMVFSTVYRMD